MDAHRRVLRVGEKNPRYSGRKYMNFEITPWCFEAFIVLTISFYEIIDLESIGQIVLLVIKENYDRNK